ncbi:MAG: hypothetical protein M5R42_08165 [Rhodocyclaceae bacterium]|nr:hypothetical protein [Rhodocyclaceae bacterium]
MRVLGITLATAALAYFSFVTLLRSNQFGEEIRRTQLEAQHHRGSARAQYEAGRVLAGQAEAIHPEMPTYSLARAHFERAGEVGSAFKLGWLGLIYLNCRAGMTADSSLDRGTSSSSPRRPFGPGDGRVLLSLRSYRSRETFASSARMSNPFLLRWPTRLPRRKAVWISILGWLIILSLARATLLPPRSNWIARWLSPRIIQATC